MESMAFKRRIPPSPVYSMPLHFSNGKAGNAFQNGKHFRDVSNEVQRRCIRKSATSTRIPLREHSSLNPVSLQFLVQFFLAFLGHTKAIHEMVVGDFGERSESTVLNYEGAISQTLQF